MIPLTTFFKKSCLLLSCFPSTFLTNSAVYLFFFSDQLNSIQLSKLSFLALQKLTHINTTLRYSPESMIKIFPSTFRLFLSKMWIVWASIGTGVWLFNFQRSQSSKQPYYRMISGCIYHSKKSKTQLIRGSASGCQKKMTTGMNWTQMPASIKDIVKNCCDFKTSVRIRLWRIWFWFLSVVIFPATESWSSFKNWTNVFYFA